MRHRLPPLNPLRAFEAAARLNSVSGAAQELNVTHGAVSHQIKALEARLGHRLFTRSPQRLQLTQEGSMLFPAVSQAFEDIAAATARLGHPTTSGTVNVACVPALLSYWLLPRLAEFLDRFPNINLSLTATNDPASRHSRDIDVSIFYGQCDWKDSWTRLLSDLRLFPVLSPKLLKSKPLHSLNDLSRHTLLHGDGGREWQTWMAASNYNGQPCHREIHMSNATLAIEAARHGQGVALGDSVTVSSLVALGELARPIDISTPANDAYYVVCRNEARNSPIVGIFIDWLFMAFESSAIAAARPNGQRGRGSF